jgi:hypothetical protein
MHGSTTTQTNLISLFKEQLENEATKIADKYGDSKRGNLLIWWYFIRLHGFEAAEVEPIIVDGGGELGIDVIYIDESDIVHFYQFKNPYRVDKEFPASEADKVISGLHLILNKKHHKVANESLKQKIEDIYQIVPSGYRLHIVTSGKGIAEEAKVKLDNFVEGLSASRQYFSWYPEDISVLQDQFYRRNLPAVDDPLYFVVDKGQPYQVRSGEHDCYMFHCGGDVLAKFYEKHGEQLLQQNIRVFEGNRSTNASIKQTCETDDAAHFFHFNNGVTFLCEKAEWDGFTHRLTLHKAQVVNGGQTVRVLNSVFRANTLRKEVVVPVRVITSQGNKEFANNVAVNLNNQNKVDDSFLKSNDPRVVQLAHSLASTGWYLERRENEINYMTQEEIERLEKKIGASLEERTIRLKEGTQAYAATFLRQPELAKKNPKKLFLSINDGGDFERIFNQEITAERVIYATRVKRVVNAFVEDFSKMKRRKPRLENPVEEYRGFLGSKLYDEHGEVVDQCIPQSGVFLAAIIFEEHVRIHKNCAEELVQKIESDQGWDMCRGRVYDIIQFAKDNPQIATKSWPTLLKSQQFFENVAAYLRGKSS